MAKFLTTVGNSYYIEQIIINSTGTLTLVTPFLKLSQNLIERISDADNEGIRITLIYGKNELSESEKQKLNTLKNIEIYFCQNLHAKCYHNGEEMIITSMNLYEFSERNNREMGLLIEKETDGKIFEDSIKEIESIKNSSILEKEFSDKEDSDSDELIQLDPNYNEKWNFHLPSLTKILKQRYPNHNILFDDSIIIQDFPQKGSYMIVNGRIDLVVENKKKYDTIKKLNKGKFSELLPKIRFYWNYKQLNIYREKKFTPELNINGLREQIEKYLLIIDTIDKNLEY